MNANSEPHVEGTAAHEKSLLGDEARSDAHPSNRIVEYETIFENAIVGVCFMRRRTVLRCNWRFEEIFGYSRGELDNQPVRTLYASEEDYIAVGKMYSLFLQNNAYVHERPLIRKDREIIWCIISGRAIDPSDPERGSVWVVQDITDRKRAEDDLKHSHALLELRFEQRTINLRKAYQALKAEVERRKGIEQAFVASREKYRILFRMFPVGIAITDTDGQIVEMNRALQRLSNCRTPKAFEELGSERADIIRADGSFLSKEEFARLRTIGGDRNVDAQEIGLKRPDGSRVWINVSAVPIPVTGYGAVAAYTDITEQKRARDVERQLRTEIAHVGRQKAMGEVASAFAHELGQPLTACLSYVQGIRMRLASGVSDPRTLDEALAQAIRHIEHAGEIVRHVNRFVRHHQPHSEPTDLARLVAETLHFLRFELRAGNVSLKEHYSPEVPSVTVDRVEIQQVIHNLLINGIEAMVDTPEAKRTLEVRVVDKGPKWVELSVADIGPGVPKELWSRIWDPYFTTKPDGLGFGLAICRSIVESHGGKLSVGSRRRGGAVFRVWLSKCRECP